MFSNSFLLNSLKRFCEVLSFVCLVGVSSSFGSCCSLSLVTGSSSGISKLNYLCPIKSCPVTSRTPFWL